MNKRECKNKKFIETHEINVITKKHRDCRGTMLVPKMKYKYTKNNRDIGEQHSCPISKYKQTKNNRNVGARCTVPNPTRTK